MPFSAIARASSEACGWVKPAGNMVDPATGPGVVTDIVQF
jgi:hypothetical protein